MRVGFHLALAMRDRIISLAAQLFTPNICMLPHRLCSLPMHVVRPAWRHTELGPIAACWLCGGDSPVAWVSHRSQTIVQSRRRRVDSPASRLAI